MSQKPLSEDRVDWVKEASSALAYFMRQNIKIEDIIEEASDRIRKDFEEINLENLAGKFFINRVKEELVKRRINPYSREMVVHGGNLSSAITLYCIYKKGEYKDFL